MTNETIFDFTKEANIKGWRIVDDVVMGGRSAGEFMLNEEGHGVFKGSVSTENNGGFSSVRFRFEEKIVSLDSKIILNLKGDGKDYQFRVKDESSKYYSYITSFSTSGEWEEIEISLKDLYPSFRGRKLDQPNFEHSSLEEITFLIANKKNENFELLVDKIELRQG